MFDSPLDSGENAAVGRHHYNLRPLRLILTFKLGFVVDEETARLFWSCILEPNEEKAYALLPKVCEGLLANLHLLPDEKSRQVLGEGLEWVRTRPRSIQIHTDRKVSRQGHFPNLVAFTNLLDGLDDFARRLKRPVANIIHDQQSEFQRTLQMWHELFTNASPGEVRWAGEAYTLQKVPGSNFSTMEDSKSAGIQIADIILWLYTQFRKGRELPRGCRHLVEYVFLQAWESDSLSLVWNTGFPPNWKP